jgi:hypothetical protein
MFRVRRKQYYVVPSALRLGIEQVVYAGALYDAAIVDTDYEKLDSLTLGTVRHILQVPPFTPTAFLRWELRLPPSRLRAHKRAIRWAQQLWHESWIGRVILQPYLTGNTQRDQADATHPFFSMGPVGRLTRILREYGLTWKAINGQKPKEAATLRMSHERTRAAFLPWIRAKLEDSKGIPQHHREELAIQMGVDEGSERWKGQRNPQDLPLYLFIEGDLPRAGLWARMPYLRVQLRGAHRLRAPCAWCRGQDREHGHHLMRCTRMPPRLRRRRDAVLQTILEDVAEGARCHHRHPQPDEPTSARNLDRLFYLHWEGPANWRTSATHPRADRHAQPSKEVLTAALWYFRDLLNTYRRSTKGTGPGDANPVWELPVYNTDTDHYTDPGPWAVTDNDPLPPPPIQIGDSLANLTPPPEEPSQQLFGLSPAGSL